MFAKVTNIIEGKIVNKFIEKESNTVLNSLGQAQKVDVQKFFLTIKTKDSEITEITELETFQKAKPGQTASIIYKKPIFSNQLLLFRCIFLLCL